MVETDWIAAIQRGDTNALEEVIGRYGSYVMAVVEHTLGKIAAEQDKEELVSDTFVVLWKNAAKLKPDSCLKSWLAVVARHAAINKARSIHPEEELQEDFMVTDDDAVSIPMERTEQVRIVREAVDGLGEEDRMLFLRHYFWHHSIPDIAACTGMNPSTIKSRLFRGRQALKTVLTQKGYTL
jgi:RNA polymerase sigma-70 factor (ECF subfamily)